MRNAKTEISTFPYEELNENEDETFLYLLLHMSCVG